MTSLDHLRGYFLVRSVEIGQLTIAELVDLVEGFRNITLLESSKKTEKTATHQKAVVRADDFENVPTDQPEGSEAQLGC
jgi:hypothetical protein